MALDSDFAGLGAAVRGIEALKNGGLDVAVARLPSQYKDPDEFAKADPSGWGDSVANAQDVWAFMIDVIFAKHQGQSGSEKAKIGTEAVAVLSRITDEIERIHHTKNVAERLQVPYELIAKRVGLQSEDLVQKEVIIEEKTDRRAILEERLMSLAFVSGPKVLIERNLIEIVRSSLYARILQEYVAFNKRGQDWDIAAFGRSLPPELFSGFVSLVVIEDDDVDHVAELNTVEHELQELILREMISDVSQQIAEFERKGEENELLAAQRKLSVLTQKRSQA